MIPPPRFHNLTNRLGWLSGKPKADITCGEAMYLWMAQFMAQTTALTSDQIDLILVTFGRAIQKFGQDLSDAIQRDLEKLEIGHLAIADSRYATISGAAAFVDLASGEMINGLRRAPAIMLHYNMGEIYIRGVAMLNKEIKDGGSKDISR
jgi:hypothetical protein